MTDEMLIDHLKMAAGKEGFGSQSALARAAKRGRSTVSEWMTGKYKPDCAALLNMDAEARRRRLKIRFDPRKLRPELF